MPSTPTPSLRGSRVRIYAAAAFALAAAGAGDPACLNAVAGLVPPPTTPTPTPYTKPDQVRPNLPASPLEELQSESQQQGGLLPPLIREGSFIPAARGQMVKGKSGRWFFIFDRDASGRILPPMVLMPSINLAAMERMAEHSPTGTRMLVTGQVTVYHDLNYFLPTAPPMAVRAEPPAPAPTIPAAPSPAGPAAPASSSPQAAPHGAEPSVDDIVKRLDKAIATSNSNGVVAAPVRTNAVAPNEPTETTTPQAPAAAPGHSGVLLSAGVISSRRGRISRARDGTLVFHLDSGTTDLGGKSPVVATEPLVLQPSQTLAAIEALSERSGENATYTVSGEVTTYHDRNYLLIRSYKVNRVSDQVMPTQ